MYDYNTKQPWPSGEAEHKPVEWLSVGAGCTARTGSARDAHMAAWDVMYAAMSILVEVPIEHPEDEAALLSTLIYTNWRVPTYQRQRVARRFARYVSNCIEGERFVPTSD
jgi:hypothetical protein